MQENTLRSIAPKSSRTPFFLSIFFALLMIGFTIVAFVLGKITAGNISQIEGNISLKNTEISEIKKDKKIIITNILRSGTVRPSLDLRGVVNNFRDAASRSKVRLKGFAIANDTITTNLIATEVDPLGHPDPASTIIAMMRAYDNPNGLGTFRLDPIKSITGDTKSRTTSIQFRVSSNK